MKVCIEVSGDIPEDEVIIRCRHASAEIQRLSDYITREFCGGKITFFRDGEEFFFSLDRILFFETESEQIYAHTAREVFLVKFRLRELEKLLPRTFVRAAKGAIVNIAHVYSITRSVTSASLIKFNNSHKQVYVSRHYFSELRQRLNERNF